MIFHKETQLPKGNEVRIESNFRPNTETTVINKKRFAGFEQTREFSDNLRMRAIGNQSHDTNPKPSQNIIKQNTKHSLDAKGFFLSEPPKEFSQFDGLIPVPIIIDLIVGEEIGIFWFDRTPFINELARIRPFQMRVKIGTFPTSYGLLPWLLFCVLDPAKNHQPFASVVTFANPANKLTFDVWRSLAKQTHWHLILIGQNNSIVDLLEFENDYKLDVALEVIGKDSGIPVEYLHCAKEEFYGRYSMDDLYNMS